jgi:hypothetical protein
VIDLATLQGWIEERGYRAAAEGPAMLRLTSPGTQDLPPFFVQLSENWVLFSMLPMLAPGEYRGEDLGRRLLLENREMRLAKFALDRHGMVVLCAELPTESLQASEVGDALTRVVQYARRFLKEFSRRR